MLTIADALIGTWALISGSFFIICVAGLNLGMGLTSHQYFRFAAAEVVSKEWRPVAISLMLTSGLIAAFIGPQIFIMTKEILAPIPLEGGYAAIAGFGSVVLCVVTLVFVMLSFGVHLFGRGTAIPSTPVESIQDGRG